VEATSRKNKKQPRRMVNFIAGKFGASSVIAELAQKKA